MARNRFPHPGAVVILTLRLLSAAVSAALFGVLLYEFVHWGSRRTSWIIVFVSATFALTVDLVEIVPLFDPSKKVNRAQVSSVLTCDIIAFLLSLVSIFVALLGEYGRGNSPDLEPWPWADADYVALILTIAMIAFKFCFCIWDCVACCLRHKLRRASKRLNSTSLHQADRETWVAQSS